MPPGNPDSDLGPEEEKNTYEGKGQQVDAPTTPGGVPWTVKLHDYLYNGYLTG